MDNEFRKFWLVNSLGNTYELSNPEKKVFLSGPSGLGFTSVYSSERLGTSELITYSDTRLPDVSGTLLFFLDSNGFIYNEYQNFIDFIKYKPLELHYQTPNLMNSFYSEVIITKFEKTENTKSGLMQCPITFHRITNWLNDEDFTIILTNAREGSGKNYPVSRPYYYVGTNLSNTPIIVRGTDSIGFVIEINGTVQNPYFALTQGTDRYGVCRILGTYDYMMINSNDTAESIYLENNGVVIANPQQYQDFSIRDGIAYLTWIKLKVGENIFTFNSNNIDTFDGTITIRYKNSYVSV